MMEAVSTSETSVNFYQTTRRNYPDDSYLKSSQTFPVKCTMFLPSTFIFLQAASFLEVSGITFVFTLCQCAIHVPTIRNDTIELFVEK
jgi:hypothetical protein